MPGYKRRRPPWARGRKKIKKKKSSMNVEEVSDSFPEYVEEAADSSPEKIGEAPHPELPDYHGPYQREMLEAARADLISIVDNADSTLWKGIWMKTGIHENGQRDLSFEGYGKYSCTYCHDGFPGPIEQPDLGILDATESGVTSELKSTGSCEHLVETNEQIDKKQTDVEKASDSDDNVKQLEHEISVPGDETYHSFIYKCDFCNIHDEDDSSMNRHLDSDQHYSASSYWLDEDRNITCIKDKMSLTNSSAMYRKKLAVCALEVCREPFSNIFDCASHFVSAHDQSSEPIYSLVDVDEELYKNQINPLECIKCRSQQKNARTLTTHYHQMDCTMPFSGEAGNYCRFVCLNCMKCFRSVRQILHHQVKEHRSTAVDGQVEMRVLYCSNRSKHYLDNGGKEFSVNDKLKLNEVDTCKSNDLNDSGRKSYITRKDVKTVQSGTQVIEAHMDETGIVNVSETTYDAVASVVDDVSAGKGCTMNSASQNKPDNAQTDIICIQQSVTSINKSDVSQGKDEISVAQKLTGNVDENEVIVIDDEDDETVIVLDGADRVVNSPMVDSMTRPSAIGESARNQTITTSLKDSTLEINESVTTDASFGSIYKCDFCDIRYENDSAMNQHLVSHEHYSASSYWLDEHGSIARIKDKISLTNSRAMYRKKLALCALDSCTKPFSNIFDCASHFFSDHNQFSDPMYSLVDVVGKVYRNQINPLACIKCRRVIEREKTLVSHYHQGICRMPFVGKEDKYYRFVCLNCMKCFKYLRHILSHQVTGHGSTAVDGQVEMKVLYCFNRTVHYLKDGGREMSFDDKLALSKMKTLKSKDVNDPGRKSDYRHMMVENEEVEVISDDSSDCGVDKTNAGDSSSNLPVSAENKASILAELNDILMNDEALSNVLDQEILDSDTVETADVNENSLQVKYKCDYCDYLSDQDEEMRTHLETESHGSASGININPSNNAMFLNKPMQLQNMHGMFKKVIAVCPDLGCQAVFPSIFVCSEHFSLYHNGAVEPTYALSKIEGTDTTKYCKALIQCSFCGQKFAKRTSLHTHIVHKKHARRMHSKACKICFRCMYCLFLSSDYITLAKHLNLRHAHIRVQDGMYQMHVMYIKKEKMIKEIPPRLSSIDSRKKGIQERISNLMELKHLTDLKKDKQKIQSQIDGFKKLLGVKDR